MVPEYILGLGSKVTALYWPMGGFCLVVDLHGLLQSRLIIP